MVKHQKLLSLQQRKGYLQTKLHNELEHHTIANKFIDNGVQVHCVHFKHLFMKEIKKKHLFILQLQ